MIASSLKRDLAAIALVWLGVATAGFDLVIPIEDATRVRNSLIARLSDPSSFDWTPPESPAGFLAETGPKPAELIAAVQASGASASAGVSDFERAKRLARHLASGTRYSGVVASTTLRTYRVITTEGRGYCADFTQVFNALAYVADIPVRQWGFTFDSFGGHGHAINEIYDRSLRKWVLVDAFNSFVVVDRATDQPLSVLEFRERLQQPAPLATLRIERLSRQFGFRDDAMLIDYFRDGVDQYFLDWGNNSLSYDRDPLVRTLGPLSRTTQQLAGILSGSRPKIHVMATGAKSTEHWQTLQRTRWMFWCWFVATVLVAVATGVFALRWRRTVRAT